ncbi:hypothetical protein SapgrDRAFT_3213 [Saprospira grandis DSM 2844]|uniref:Co-chaperone DjlA N-terminal domain-containing protein n=1 Tax=Saprospira grandis DSM 2844 TaxID=694433 RepID=J1I8R2_9BACT|nr:hypothetical protein [Saprospira grandis]EJF54858.1 hypothetical protein SapgrDRAFT_3213 [Saprospira grandis DSM 2844]
MVPAIIIILFVLWQMYLFARRYSPKKVRKSHMLALITIAESSDSKGVSPVQLEYLKIIATVTAVSTEELYLLLKKPVKKFRYHPPRKWEHRVRALEDLVHMMHLEGLPTKAQFINCYRFAKRLDLPKELIEEITKDLHLKIIESKKKNKPLQ